MKCPLTDAVLHHVMQRHFWLNRPTNSPSSPHVSRHCLSETENHRAMHMCKACDILFPEYPGLGKSYRLPKYAYSKHRYGPRCLVPFQSSENPLLVHETNTDTLLLCKHLQGHNLTARISVPLVPCVQDTSLLDLASTYSSSAPGRD